MFGRLAGHVTVVVALVLSGALTTLAPASAAPREPETPALVVGTLTDPSGQPIADARVDAVPVDGLGDPSTWVTTFTSIGGGAQYNDEHQPDGRFRLELPDGTYRIRFLLDGATVPSWYGGGSGTAIAVVSGQYYQLDTAVLTPPTLPVSTVTGVAVDAGGDPLADDEVYVYRWFDLRGWRFVAAQPTDGQGLFSVAGLRRGVPLAFCVSGYWGIYCDGRDQAGYPDDADGRVLTSGALDLGELKLAEVTVTVPMDADAAAQLDDPYMYLVDDEGDERYGDIADGVATVPGVRPGGAYRMCVYTPTGEVCQDEPFTVPTDAAVFVAPPFTLPAAGTISGVLQTAGGQAVSGIEVAVYAFHVDSSVTQDTAVTNAQGEFTLLRPLGDEDAQFQVCVSGFLDDATPHCVDRSGSWTIFDSILTLRPDETEVVLDHPVVVPEPVTLRGRVVHADGSAATDQQVQVVNRSSDDSSYPLDYLTTDTEGRYSMLVFGPGKVTSCTVGFSVVCLGGADLAADGETATVGTGTPVDLPDLVVANSTGGSCQSVRDNGTTEIGMRCEGALGVYTRDDDIGLRRSSSSGADPHADAVTYGCACEGWGIGDAVTGASGYATAEGDGDDLTLQSFTGGASVSGPVSSTVTAADGTFQVTHTLEESAVTPNAYLLRVAVTNVSDETAQLRYRRTVDFDLAPNPTVEFVSIDDGNTPDVAFASNDGFASPDPFTPRTSLGPTSPGDQGALLDLDLGELAVGDTKSFTLSYGIAATADEAQTALASLHPTAYALAVGTSDGVNADGEAAFLTYGIDEDASADRPVTHEDTVEVSSGRLAIVSPLDNDTDPNDEPLVVVSSSQPRHGSASCTSQQCVYFNNGDGKTTDSFTYTARNLSGRTKVGIVRVTVVPDDGSPPTNVEPPSISGAAKVGSVLTATPGTWSGHVGSRYYTWRMSPTGFAEGDPTYVVQTGASPEYVVPHWMEGASVRVEETVKTTESALASGSASSQPIGPIVSAPYLFTPTTPAFSGAAQVGATLLAPATSWVAVQGGAFTPVTPALDYAWTVGGTLVGVTDRYTPTVADAGKDLELSITATHPAGAGQATGRVNLGAGRVLGATVRQRTVQVTVKKRGESAALSQAYVVLCADDCYTATYDAGPGAFVVTVPATAGGRRYRAYVTPDDRNVLSANVGVNVTTGDLPQEVLVELESPQPVPASVTFAPTHGTVSVGATDVPVAVVGQTTGFSVTGCAEPDRTWTLTFSNGTAPSTGSLVPGATVDGLTTYTASIPALATTGYATVSTNVRPDCGAPATEDPFTIYIDPSGVVTDQFGRPISDATVTLLSRQSGAFAPVPNGSTVMSPANRSNPSLTNGAGYFRWDVEPGTYKVSVSDATSGGASCNLTSTDPMDVPPPRLDLVIKVSCPGASAPTSTTPTLSGVERAGEVLTATHGSWSGGLAYELTEWLRDGTVVATGDTYQLTSADLGKRVVARVTARRPSYVQETLGGQVVTFDPAHVDLTSGVVQAAASSSGGGGSATAPANTALPTIGGVAKVGQTLTADPGSWDTSGLAYAYRWLRDGTPIGGATGPSYTATPADLGKAVSVRVTASKSGLPDGTASSGGVTVDKGKAPEVLSPPVITGTAARGEKLRVSAGSWDVGDLTFGYQWLRDGSPISGAVGSTYRVRPGDAGHGIGAVVTASREAYADGTAEAAPRTVLPVPPATSTTSARLVDDTVKAGQRGTLKVVVKRADGDPAVGTIRVVVDGTQVTTVTLTAADHGRATVELPKLDVGRHRVRVSYLGNADVEPSRSALVRLVVEKHRQHRVSFDGLRLPSLF